MRPFETTKPPLQKYSRGGFVVFLLIIFTLSGSVRTQIFYKSVHNSQLFFTFLIFFIISLYIILYFKDNIKINFYIIFITIIILSVILGEDKYFFSIAFVYFFVLILLSILKLRKYSTLMISYLSVISGIQSLWIYHSVKAGLLSSSSVRASGFYGQPNLLAALMLIGIFSYYDLIYKVKKKSFIYHFPPLLLWFVFFLTASRAGIFAIGICALLIVFIWKKPRLEAVRPFWVKVAIVIILSWLISQLYGDWSSVSRVEAAWSDGGGVYKRFVFWLSAILMGHDHWFLGVGFGGYSQNLGDYAIKAAEILKLPYDTIDQTLWAHNDFLHIFAEHGLITFVLSIVFVFLLLRNFWVKLSKNNVFILLGFVSFLVMMCFGHPLYFHNLALNMCFFVSPIIGLSRRNSFQISNKKFKIILLIFLLFISTIIYKHFYQMYNLEKFRKSYILNNDEKFNKYKELKFLYLEKGVDNPIYGWRFKHSLYTNLSDYLFLIDNKKFSKYVLSDMIKFESKNSFPSYSFSLAKVFYLLGDYENSKRYSYKAFERKPDVDKYFDLYHLSNALSISRNENIKISKLISKKDLQKLKKDNILKSRQFSPTDVAL